MMLRSSLGDHSDAYIVVSGRITIAGAGANNDAKRTGKRNKEAILANCAPFIECTSKKNNTQIDHAKNLDIVMPMY